MLDWIGGTSISEVGENKGRIGSESSRRKEWVKPALKVIAAGSAELEVGPGDDTVDKS